MPELSGSDAAVFATAPLAHPLTGTAVIATGHGDRSSPVVAIWHVSPEGISTNAWVVDQTQAFGDRDTARTTVTCLDGRALTAKNLETLSTVLPALHEAAGLDAPPHWWSRRVFSPIDAFADVVQRRKAIDERIAAVRSERKNVATVEWRREFTGPLPRTFDDVRRLSGLAVAPGPDGISEAITVARVLRWLVEIWAETEQVKNRRDYLRGELGAVEPLPPSWLSAVLESTRQRVG